MVGSKLMTESEIDLCKFSFLDKGAVGQQHDILKSKLFHPVPWTFSPHEQPEINSEFPVWESTESMIRVDLPTKICESTNGYRVKVHGKAAFVGRFEDAMSSIAWVRWGTHDPEKLILASDSPGRRYYINTEGPAVTRTFAWMPCKESDLRLELTHLNVDKEGFLNESKKLYLLSFERYLKENGFTTVHGYDFCNTDLNLRVRFNGGEGYELRTYNMDSRQWVGIFGHNVVTGDSYFIKKAITHYIARLNSLRYSEEESTLLIYGD